MTHLHKKSGQTFEIGSYVDTQDGKTYDITIITYWKDADTQDVGSPLELVGFYFGDYDEVATDCYIDEWLSNRNKEIRVLQAAKSYMDAYLLTNSDVLEQVTTHHLERMLFECGELLYNRSWKFEDGHVKEWYEAEKIKRLLNKCMENPEVATSIKITIEQDGTTTTADLYDHAALVTSLFDSLAYFQSEL